MIKEKNLARAKEDAISAGLSSAVEQAALRLFPPDGLAEVFQQFTDLVRQNTADYVENYKVLAEFPGKEEYRVMLTVTVSAEKLKERLGLKVPEIRVKTPLKILFLLAEQGIKQLAPQYWWGENTEPLAAYAETAMSVKMKSAGFEIIEHGLGVPKVAIEASIIFQPDLENVEAVDIGRHLKADMVVAGKAFIYKAMDQEGDIPAFNATVTGRVVRTDTKEEIMPFLETIVEKSTDETTVSQTGLESAAQKAADKIIPQLSAIWEEMSSPTDLITLAVTGTQNLGNFVRFRKSLNQAAGVKDIQVHEMTGNAAIIKVRFEGEASSLAEILKNMPFDPFTITVHEIGQGQIKLDLTPKPS
jgi:hypothetical protein